MLSMFGASPGHAAPTPATRPAPTVSPEMATRIDAYLQQLGDPNAQKRDEAMKKLVEIGWYARPAVKAACATPNVLRRNMALAVLARLPLFAPGDAPAVRDALTRYGKADLAGRPRIALRLLANRTPEMRDAFLRILSEEQDDAVLWTIVLGLPQREATDLSSFGSPTAGFDLGQPLAPAVRYWIGSSLLASDQADSKQLAVEQYQRVLDEAATIPQAATPALLGAANVLCAAGGDDPAREIAIRRQVALLTPAAIDPAQAAGDLPPRLGNLDRRVMARIGASVDDAGASDGPELLPPLSEPIMQYLAARLRLHDASGVGDDLQAMGVSPDHPVAALMLAVLTRPDLVKKDAPLTQVPAELAPFVETLDDDTLCDLCITLRSHANQPELADAISRRGMTRIGERLAKTSPNDPRKRLPIELQRMRLALVRLASARDAKDAAAEAEMKRAAQTVVLRAGENATGLYDAAFAMYAPDVVARQFIDDVLRADRAGDEAARDVSLDALARVSPLGSNATLDAIYVLESHGRVAEADEVFGEQLQEARERLDQAEDDYTANNSIAWLCARAGRDLERAYQHAARANQIVPGQPSLMDTQAEAAFRTGRVDEAIRLETRALAIEDGGNRRGGALVLGGALDDDDRAFLATQLARFKAGIRPGEAAMPLPSESWDDAANAEVGD